MTRKMAYIGSSYFVGLFFASFLSSEMSVVAVFILMAAAFLVLAFKKSVNSVVVCLTVMAFAVCHIIVYTTFVYDKAVSCGGEIVSFSGTVEECRNYGEDRSGYIVRTSVNGASCKVLLYSDSENIGCGDRIDFSGLCEIPENSYTFSSFDYYKSKGIFLVLYDADIVLTKDVFSLKDSALEYRDYVFGIIDNYLPGEEGALIKALSFGDKSDINDETDRAFSRSGIKHIIAVSGFHLSVVSTLIFMVLKPLGLRRVPAMIVTEAFLIAFAVMAGLSMSIIRAVIMMTVFFAAEGFSRRSDVFNSLGIAAVVLTVSMPFSVRDSSLLLSLVGVFGIGVVAPYFTKNIKSKALASFIAVVVCSVVTAPAVTLLFGGVSIVSPLCNILITPFCSFSLMCGVIVALTGGISVIAAPVLMLGGLSAKAALFLAEITASLPMSYVTVERFSYTLILALAAMVVLSFLIFRERKFTVMTTLASLAVIVAANMFYYHASSDMVTVTSFGGNSDCFVIHDRNNAVVIGGDGKKQAEHISEYLGREGIDTLDVLVLTDNSQRFISAYEDNLGGIEVGGVMIRSDDYFLDGSEVFGKVPERYSDGGVYFECDGYTVTLDNENISIDFGSFALAKLKNGAPTKDYTVIINDTGDDFDCACAYLLDGGESYTVKFRADSRTKVVEI